LLPSELIIHADVVQYFSQPQPPLGRGLHAILIQFGVCLGEPLEPVWIFFQVTAEHAKNASCPLIPHVVYLGIGNVEAANVIPYVFFKPKCQRL
jgi:hypothetical protein